MVTESKILYGTYFNGGAYGKGIGGLGIYMVKKSMDDISYEYKNGQNILRIKKNI